ncbi:MAG: DUF4869 domain-containing protein [Ruminococcus flavefaciens]|nr:DUF4869 domain-containing protein [Ruminococcus flavefaciens]
MLKIYYGDMEEAIFDTSGYFDVVYEDSWIISDFAKKIIKDIDKSEVLGANCIQSPVLGQIPPTSIAGGTKTLLLIYNESENVFNASTCGDNCAKWILEIAKERDVTINLRHFMHFGFKPWEKLPQKVQILNSGQIIDNGTDFIEESIKYLQEMP